MTRFIALSKATRKNFFEKSFAKVLMLFVAVLTVFCYNPFEKERGEMETLRQKTKKDVYDQEYKKINYDQVAIRVKKGKREEYQQAADRLGLSYSEMIRLAIETFIAVRSGGDFTTARPDRISADDRALLNEFNQLPAETRSHFLKGFKAINQLIEDQEKSRQELVEMLQGKFSTERQNQPQNQAP